MDKRISEIHRKTGETDITIRFDIDGSGKADLSTGIGFFDHMMDAFTRHGLFDLTLKAEGDLDVDGHHTVEDTGIAVKGISTTFYMGQIQAAPTPEDPSVPEPGTWALLVLGSLRLFWLKRRP